MSEIAFWALIKIPATSPCGSPSRPGGRSSGVGAAPRPATNAIPAVAGVMIQAPLWLVG